MLWLKWAPNGYAVFHQNAVCVSAVFLSCSETRLGPESAQMYLSLVLFVGLLVHSDSMVCLAQLSKLDFFLAETGNDLLVDVTSTLSVLSGV